MFCRLHSNNRQYLGLLFGCWSWTRIGEGGYSCLLSGSRAVVVIADRMEASWLLTLAVGLLAVWLIRYYMSLPKNLPPGPSLLSLLQGIWNLMRGRTEPQILLSSWAERYGEIVSFYIGPKPFVVLNSYPVIVEAFRHPDLQDRPQSRMMLEVFGTINGVAFSNGETWKEQRKFVHSVFRSLGVGKKTYEDTVAAEMAQLTDAIKDKKGEPFDPGVPLGQSISNIISTILFGTQYTYGDAEFLKLQRIINTNLEISGGGGVLYFLGLPGISKLPFGHFKMFVDNLRDLNAFILSQIESHEENLDPDNPNDFIDRYLIKIAENEGSSSSFTRRSMAASIEDVITGGFETTTATLKWCILYMIAYPEIQSRVQDELDHVVGRNRLPKLDDRKDLPFTSAVLMEAQRKASLVPLGVPHSAANDVVVQGYTIPKGAVVLSNIWNVLSSDELWKDSDDFKPDRFLTEDGEFIKRDELIFFSTGRRVCLGEQLARMETFLGFTSLLHRFTFKKPDESESLSFKGVLGLTRNTTPYMTCAVLRE